MNRAATPGIDSTKGGPAAGPSTLAAVATASAVVQSAAITVTAAGPGTPSPVRGSTMWLYLVPSISTA
jgi:hypothetical protein